jgi:toxin ParE1/3/4
MTPKYRVLLTEGAEQDLEAMHDYIAEFDDPANADHVLDRLVAAAERLAIMLERGSFPRELLDLGIKDYRQEFFKSYRLIYRVVEHQIVVFVIVDERRDMQSLLTRRLLGS